MRVAEECWQPGGAGSDITSSWFYNSSDQLYKLSQPDLADTLYVYDTLGGLVREGLDVGGNAALDLASSDRITDHAWTFFSPSSGVWWRRETTSTYATAGSGTATQVAKVETQLSGLPANRHARTDTYDIFGNVTSQTVDVGRSGKTVTSTTTYPDSSTSAVQIAYNGLTVSSTDKTNLTTTFGFDALGRPVTSVDPRTGPTTTAYVSGTSQVSTVTDPAGITQATYTYDSAGRVSSVKDALNKYAYTSYTTRGEVYRQWGDTTNPVEYAYDTYGRRITMSTYRAGSGWTASTWPSAPGTADTTTWAYQDATGLLTAKTDAAGKAVTYTYTQAGQIATRQWARILSGTTHVTTTYSYSTTTRELTSVSYNDGTSGLTLDYNRLGQSTNATQTISGGLVNTFDRCICGKVITDYLDSTFYGGRQINYDLNSTADGTKGRTLGYTLTQGTTTEQALVYGYDTSGRPNAFTADTVAFSYAYTANSNLLASITQSASNWTQTRTYQSNRDLLDVIETKISTASKAKFDYAHDNLGRRTSVAKTGELFNRYGNGTQGLDTFYGYDDRSEITSEVTKLGGSATVLTGRDDSYAYDNSGNRSSTAGTSHNSNTASYTANALNQYTARSVPGVFDVAGGAATSATVTVNSSSTGVTRHGEYFFKGQGLSNNPNPVYSALAVSDGTTTTTVPAFLAGTPEALTYDDDGNLLSDGRWARTYDAENRLIAMETTAAAYGTGITRQKLEFRLDYLGRRVGKKVYHYSSGWVLDSETRFVYDGWNMIEELGVSGSTITKLRTHAWGLDWSGSRQGAGGVGGLLLTKDGSDTYLPLYDGNGNMHGRIKSADGSLAAVYEFDAFGQTLRESGPYAATNAFRFSTKFTDIETGEVNYGLRIYLPNLGRFANKDPIGERGGLNLYAFAGNNGVNQMDYLGLDLVLWRNLDNGGDIASGGSLPTMVVTAQSDALIRRLLDMTARLLAGRSKVGGSGGGKGTGTSTPTTTDTTTVNTPPPGSETVALDPFVVTGTPPPEPPQFIIPNITRTFTFNTQFSSTFSLNLKPEKWDIQKCSDLWDQIQSNNSQFQRVSTDLNTLLDFQRDANLTLFGVDRARETSVQVAAAGLAEVIGLIRAGLQATPAMSNVLLASSGTFQLGSRSLYDVFLAGIAGAGVNHVVGHIGADLSAHPFAAATNAVRGQIQNTVNSLNSQTQGLANTLSAQRKDYKDHCQ